MEKKANELKANTKKMVSHRKKIQHSIVNMKNKWCHNIKGFTGLQTINKKIQKTHERNIIHNEKNKVMNKWGTVAWTYLERNNIKAGRISDKDVNWIRW